MSTPVKFPEDGRVAEEQFEELIDCQIEDLVDDVEVEVSVLPALVCSRWHITDVIKKDKRNNIKIISKSFKR